jgi:hypothetical protein
MRWCAIVTILIIMRWCSIVSILTGTLMGSMADDYGHFLTDPTSCALYSFPWGTGPLQGSGRDSPRTWQIEEFDAIGVHLSNPETRYMPYLAAIASGHGIGKSAFFAMLSHWGLSTCPDTRIIVTANTDTQLRTKTWPEMAKWFGMAVNKDWFNVNATSIVSAVPGRALMWRSDAIPWNEKNPSAFQGAHNVGRRLIILFDEASGIPKSIWDAVAGALTDENTEIIFLVFGNPNQNSGPFKECFGRFRHRWRCRQIDSRTVEGVNLSLMDQWVEDYGEDSDFVRIRVRGVFPRQSFNQLISSEDIERCMRAYKASGYETMPVVLGFDCSREGDDRNSICHRQGRKVHGYRKWYSMDAMESASIGIEEYEKHDADVMYVDGGGIGGPICDRMKQLRPDFNIIEVKFSWHKYPNVKEPDKYANKRAEMWWTMRDAIHAGIELPDDNDLRADLESIQYTHTKTEQILLESKKDMKSRGLSSPDDGDALAMTYADIYVKNPIPVVAKRKKRRIRPIGATWMS